MKLRFYILMALLSMMVMPVLAQETVEAFPIEIEHQFGSTTITEVPERIVSIGYTEQDFLLALDITPVAVRYWYGDEDDAIFTWAQDKVEGDSPIVLNMPFGTLNYEAILELEPDLISAVTAGITEEEYETLSQIAPTITQTSDYINFGMPWQEVMQMIGTAVGKSGEAETIVADTEAVFADAIAQFPAIEGKTIAVAYAYEGTYGFYTSQDNRGRFFADLGFTIPDELVEIAGESFYADISAERIDLLDQDIIAIVNLQFIEGGREALESDPLFSQLEAVQNGNVIYLDEQSENALGFSSPLSLTYAIDAVLPQLEAILGSESETTDASCEAGFTLIQHAMGDTCVPDDAESVVALEWSYIEDLLALDVQPIGVADIEGYNNWVDIPVELSADVVDVGTRQEPNLEQIAMLNPDVIITSTLRSAENYDELSAIAPTIAFEGYPAGSHYDGMIDTFNTIATVVDRTAEAEAVLDALNASYAETQTALAELEVTDFVLAQSYLSSDAPVFRLFTDNAMAVEILGKIGLTNAWDDAPQQYGFTTVDFEGFDGIDDVLFFYIAQPDANEVITASPVWGVLPFVQSENAYWLGGDVWLFGGPLSAQTLVNTIKESYLLSEETADTTAQFPMTIEHEVGTTTIDAIPERIVVLEYSFADHLGTLGIAPVGFAVDAPPEYIYAYTSDVGAVDVGTRAEPNLEAILELSPDLIIADSHRHTAIYDQLNLIAPTVVFNSLRGSYDDQLEQFSIIAGILGKADEASDILASYQEHFESAMATTDAEAGEFVVGVLWSGGFTAHSNESFMGSFLESLGRTNALEPQGEETQYLLDMEGFASVNPSTIVILCNTADQEFLDDMTDSQLWQAFEAVTNNHVYAFDRNLWSKGRGVTAYEKILDDAVTSGLLANTDSPGVACGGVIPE